MDGFKFRERRENIEKIYSEANTLIEKKSIDEANLKLKETEKLLGTLSEEDLSEIQKRSALNLRVRIEYLAKTAFKLENKNKSIA
jgi:nucleotidyltransferase/DNA polymerase involved in DNA repair